MRTFPERQMPEDTFGDAMAQSLMPTTYRPARYAHQSHSLKTTAHSPAHLAQHTHSLGKEKNVMTAQKARSQIGTTHHPARHAHQSHSLKNNGSSSCTTCPAGSFCENNCSSDSYGIGNDLTEVLVAQG